MLMNKKTQYCQGVSSSQRSIDSIQSQSKSQQVILWIWTIYSLQLTLEQHGFELHRSTYTQIFFNKLLENFLEICNN